MSRLKDDKGTLVSEIIILPLKLQIVTLLSLPLVLCCSRLLTLKSLSIFLSFPLVLSLALGVGGDDFGLATPGGRQRFARRGSRRGVGVRGEERFAAGFAVGGRGSIGVRRGSQWVVWVRSELGGVRSGGSGFGRS